MNAADNSATWAVDSSALVAALLTWHGHHEAALQRIDNLLASGHELVLPLHSLIETYSVLTRLPSPHRLSPFAAVQLLEAQRTSFRLVGLSNDDGWAFIHGLGQSGTHGGRTYDALIAASARKGGATRILTLNSRHFEELDPELEVVVP
jgi:predicted nucleic acid-binding protein